jgi:hypothetical protein
VVGVDKYNNTDSGNLHGCVRDAENIYDVIAPLLGVPASNISMLTAPHDGKSGDTPHRTNAPTRANVLAEFAKFSQLEKHPGDVFIFFYSGHGGRQDTKYPNLKGASAKDELICLPNGEYIWDVELGKILTDISKQGVAVVVILDCCHSGTMDREKEPVVIRSLGDVSANRPEQPGGDGDTADALDVHPDTFSTRNAVFGHEKSYLYKDRGYNLIAACQPHEYAQELQLPGPGGVKVQQGALTYSFIQSLLMLKSAIEAVTYEALFELMQAKLKGVFPQEPRQHLRHWGDTSRFIFSAGRRGDGLQKLRASVIRKTNDLVVLDKGSSAHVAVGDQFRLYAPSSFVMGMVTTASSNTLDVVVSAVRDSETDATVRPEQAAALQGVDSGWVAQLTAKSEHTIVRVSLPDSMAVDAQTRLQQGWSALVDPCMPVTLRFDHAQVSDAAFSVDVDQGFFRVSDETGRPLPFLPRVLADGLSNVEQLMGLLYHLSAYRLVAKIPSSPKPTGPPRYSFTVKSVAHDPSMPRSLGAVRVLFENKTAEALYITILDLSSAYGVSELFPGQFNQSEAIDANSSLSDGSGMPGITIELEPPELLLSKVPKSLYLNQPPKPELKAGDGDANFKMTDVLKLFVTNAPESFAHYKVPDMEEDPAKLEIRLQELLRTLRATPHITAHPTWNVEEIIITTPNKP